MHYFLSKQRITFDLVHLRKLYPHVEEQYFRVWEQRAQKVSAWRILYQSGKLRVVGFLMVPKQRGKFPCILYNRGGNKMFGAIDEGTLWRLWARLAEQGYIIIGSQYRGNDGGEGREEEGGHDVQDVLNLLPALKEVAKADTSRVGMYGWSRGGMMTYRALTKTKRIKAAVVGGALADVVHQIRYRKEMRRVYRDAIQKKGAAFHTALKARSAIYWPEKLYPKTPILMMHGTADWRVRVTDSVRMAEALLRCGRVVRLILFEGADHGITEYRHEVMEHTLGWFDRFLKKGEKLPNTQPHGD